MTTSQQQRNPPGCSSVQLEQSKRDTYRFFDVTVKSQFPLPELPPSIGGEPVITIQQGDFGPFDPLEFQSCHEWRDSENQLLCRCSRRDADYLLSLPQQGDFLIAPGGTITCIAAPGTTHSRLRHLLLSQVLPRYIASTGELLLHASAVTLPNGSTVAFVGESGAGKSTLASYCHWQGAQIIDDDCILLRSCDQHTGIYGGVPTLRLYPDSLHGLGYDADDFVPCTNGSDKMQMRLDAAPQSVAQPGILDALFVLSPAGEAPAGDAVKITAASGQNAMMSILGNAFALDPSDRNTLRRAFERAAQVLTGGLPVYHLDFPRRHGLLPDVLQALLDPRTP
jgi:hypothetical protein